MGTSRLRTGVASALVAIGLAFGLVAVPATSQATDGPSGQGFIWDPCADPLAAHKPRLPECPSL
jgi:hypothetical protein